MSASDELELSGDGVTWTDDYAGTLFDGLVLVPGAEATATVWVRNATADAADLRFAATRLDVDRELSDTVTMQVAISGAATSAWTVRHSPSCARNRTSPSPMRWNPAVFAASRSRCE